MPDRYSRSYFHVLDEDSQGGRYRADPATGGPWDAGLQHGGPPGALLVRAAERLGASAGPDPAGTAEHLVAVRVAAEFVGPVPVGEIEVRAAVIRAARSAVLVEAAVTAGGRTCLQARIWSVRSRDTSAVAAPLSPPATEPGDAPGLGTRFPYGDSIDWHAVSGSMLTPGPARVWARPRYGLVDGEPLSGLQRVVIVGDSASGLSSELDWTQWSFLNVDLDVHLSRDVIGDWVLLDAATTLGAGGAALARSTVSDLHGVVGCTAQTLILAPR